jgi:hypothetical protein
VLGALADDSDLSLYDLELSDGEHKRRIVALPSLSKEIARQQLHLALISITAASVKYDETDPRAPRTLVLEAFERVRWGDGVEWSNGTTTGALA